MFKNKITLSKELMEKVEIASRLLCCSSVGEFVESVLEREVDKVIHERKNKILNHKDVAEITEKLKGLGYID